jgi:hypothetical protein
MIRRAGDLHDDSVKMALVSQLNYVGRALGLPCITFTSRVAIGISLRASFVAFLPRLSLDRSFPLVPR